MLKMIPLASGSKGNATLIISDNTALLVDAGISYARLTKELEEQGVSPRDLSGVVITHEHSDHIRALDRLSEDCNVYVHPLTLREIYLRGVSVKRVQDVDNYEGGFSVGDIEVTPFRIPHDAAYPLAYSFRAGRARCSIATDIGMLTRGVLRNVKDSEVVLLEANHDVTMLREGKYPPQLKARILSDKGHLSNEASGRLAHMLDGNSAVRTIVLGHISENNNTERLAYDAVSRALGENSSITLGIAHQHFASEVYEIS